MSHRYAWVEITAKVYVDQDEIDQVLSDGQDEDGNPMKTEEEAFEYLAKKAIREKVSPHDNPIKVNETIIDMSSFK